MSATATTSNGKALLDLAKEAYENGASDVEVAKVLKVTIARFHQMCEEIPDFAKFVENGRTLSQAWWVEKARANLWNKDFNTSLWNFNMKNRYGWADKIDTADKTDTENVNLDQVKGHVAAQIRRLAKEQPDLLGGAHLLNNKDLDE